MINKEKPTRVMIMVNKPAREKIKSLAALLGLTLVEFGDKLSHASLEDIKTLFAKIK